MQGRTALVIAHRLSTIRAVDRIVVFHRGRVVEAGLARRAARQGGVYARLYRLQFAQEVLAQKEAQQAGQKDAPVDPAAASSGGTAQPLRG